MRACTTDDDDDERRTTNEHALLKLTITTVMAIWTITITARKARPFVFCFLNYYHGCDKNASSLLMVAPALMRKSIIAYAANLRTVARLIFKPRSRSIESFAHSRRASTPDKLRTVCTANHQQWRAAHLALRVCVCTAIVSTWRVGHTATE